ncbi:MAG: FG-GAP-like repeat-containing protein [candidate division WOR-3 bacterium]|nr:FG-GAP-like repeat-containing protein [candidate division WOR-3 bacterium]
MLALCYNNKKEEVRIVFCLLMMFLLVCSNLYAQQTHNLQVIWQKTSPDSIIAFGRCIASGDVNGDGYSDVMIVGDAIVGPFPYRGKCWVFYGSQNFDTVPDVQLLNIEQNIFLSATSGDINSDGFSDVILGACNNAGGYGEVLIFLGGNPMDTICDYRIRGGPYQGSNFGCSVSSGDINGDGCKDLIVGAYTAYVYPVGDLAGRVYIYYGGPNFDTIPDVILNGGHNNQPEGFGYSVSANGDVNNDGYDDIIIGAPSFGPLWQGRIYIYFGGSPMNTTYDVAMMGEEPGEFIGESRGDFINNQSSYDHAIIGSPLWGPSSPQGFDPGKVYILFGGNPMDSIPDIWMVGRTAESWLGYQANSAGRCNNDFYDEVIAGAPIEYNQKGTGYLWLGGSLLLDTIPDAWIRGAIVGDGIGGEVTTAGDVDGNGRDEIMVGNYAGRIPRVWVCKYTGTGVEEIATRPLTMTNNVEVYPNPARSVLCVRCPLSVEEIKIYDITGKIVKEIASPVARNDNQIETKISLKRMPPGVYFIEVTAEVDSKQNTGNRQTTKAIKKIVITK